MFDFVFYSKKIIKFDRKVLLYLWDLLVRMGEKLVNY